MPTTITPYLIVRGAADALEWYARAFGATETLRLNEPGSDRVGHAELQIDGARFMLADEFPGMDALGPASRGGTTVSLALTVPDVDSFTCAAAAAGAAVLREPKDEFYGDRSATLRDPFGHTWHVSTPVEHVEPDEMQRRYDAIART